MKIFLRCVARVILEVGPEELAKFLTGGEFVYKVCSGVYKKYPGMLAEAEEAARQEELVTLLAVNSPDGERLAKDAVESAIAELRAAGEPVPAESELVTLVLYLSAIPSVLRQSQIRSVDPLVRTPDRCMRLVSLQDYAAVLPSRLPLFRAGTGVPGRSGWVLDRLLGLGGFAEVWLVRNPEIKSEMGAIKFFMGDAARFVVHEKDVVLKIQNLKPHSGIVPLLDANLEAEQPWLLFEYVEGGTLIDWFHATLNVHGPERLRLALDGMTPVAEALAFCHARGIVHRDIKPANVLWDRIRAQLRLIDFGIGGAAARTPANATQTVGRLPTSLYGAHTPLYSSPQQRRGEAPTPKDDIYAFGVILYQVLSGKFDEGPGVDLAKELSDAGCPENLFELIRDCITQRADQLSDGMALVGKLKQLNNPAPRPVVSSAPSPVSPPSPTVQAGSEAEPSQGWLFGWLTRRSKPTLPRAVITAYNGYRETLIKNTKTPFAERVGFVALQSKPHTHLNSVIWGDGGSAEELAAREFLKSCAREFKIWREWAETVEADARAMVLYGESLRFGIAGAPSRAEADRQLQMAVERGDSLAMFLMGRSITDGSQLLRKSADACESLAMYHLVCLKLGVLQMFGHIEFSDLIEGVFKPSGKRIAEGMRQPQRVATGVKQPDATPDDQLRMWLNTAASARIPAAMRLLGKVYDEGLLGMAKDESKAATWYRDAAQVGDVVAAVQLADCLRDGRGVTQDDTNAVAWYRKAADLRHPDAMYALAQAYETGRGVIRSESEAEAWYSRANSAGHVLASKWQAEKRAEKLRRMKDAEQSYNSAKQMSLDNPLRLLLLERAAELGHVEAKQQLERERERQRIMVESNKNMEKLKTTMEEMKKHRYEGEVT